MTSTTQAVSPSDRIAAIEAELAHHQHRRVPRDLRRRHLLALATELFSERGYAAASMDELAARAGVSKPVVYDQFGSKEGLFVEVIDALGIELSEVVLAATAGRSDPRELLEAGSLAYFRFVGERSATWLVAVGAARALEGSSGQAARKLEEIRNRQNGLMEALLLASAHSLGKQPNELQASAITHALEGAYEGLTEWWESHPEVTPEQLSRWTVDLVLPGLLAIAGD